MRFLDEDEEFPKSGMNILDNPIYCSLLEEWEETYICSEPSGIEEK